MNAPLLPAWLKNVTRRLQSGDVAEATAAIQRALAAGGLTSADGMPQMPSMPSVPPMPSMPMPMPMPMSMPLPTMPGMARMPGMPEMPGMPRMTPRPAAPPDAAFSAGTFAHAQQVHDYKLFVPPASFTGPRPLVVMLHGCTQDPDDFAAGTAMNERAREEGFYVLYPAQAQRANATRCWNWFKPNHQRAGGGGEPAWIAALTQDTIARHAIDADRVCVAGLSAGGAMAAIVARLHPELFAAAGVHSGLAPGAAHDLPGALAAMKSGAPGATPTTTVPTIVFHGDADATVHARNGEQAVASVAAVADSRAVIERRLVGHGKLAATCTTHLDAGGHAVAEHWLVHGAGHAWSGGAPAGSYTEPRGPDATREMLRFFAAHPRRASS